MLPEALSNGLCSLNPEVDRLSMVCDMRITSTGSVKEYRFYPAVIYSHARLTYNQVWDWLSGATEPEQKHAAMMPHLQALDKLFRTLLKARAKRGAIDFGSTETQINFDDQGKIKDIVQVIRNDAHRIIEECMLAANVCASDFLQENKQPALYRVHEGPTVEKLAALRSFLAEFGLDLGGGDKPHAKDYGALLDKIRDRPDHSLLQTVMLRSLKQAIYSPDNKGHFGLAYEAYTHFTSPIRRYPDLLVHRGIKAVLNDEKLPAKGLVEIGVHCSLTERRADDATRDVDAWLKTYFMQDRIGDEYNGTVSAVTSFGMFGADRDRRRLDRRHTAVAAGLRRPPSGAGKRAGPRDLRCAEQGHRAGRRRGSGVPAFRRPVRRPGGLVADQFGVCGPGGGCGLRRPAYVRKDDQPSGAQLAGGCVTPANWRVAGCHARPPSAARCARRWVGTTPRTESPPITTVLRLLGRRSAYIPGCW
jgi:hypothetical protein